MPIPQLDLPPLVSIDDDTLQAIRLLWTSNSLLSSQFPELPQTGRVKTPQTPPYVVLKSELEKRQLYGTAGAWDDTRRVTIMLYGTYSQVVAACPALLAVFHNRTELVYPSNARFYRWEPEKDVVIAEDPTSKDATDVWTATLSARVQSVRAA